MYRIHFTAPDLTRTRVAEARRRCRSLALAARALQDRSQPAWLDARRRRAAFYGHAAPATPTSARTRPPTNAASS
jgi:hypothetical protein